jgi:hypothetical protein
MHRKKWKKTFLGRKYNEDNYLFYFETLEEAKENIKQQHEYELDRGKKTLTKYRILETITKKKVHDIN